MKQIKNKKNLIATLFVVGVLFTTYQNCGKSDPATQGAKTSGATTFTTAATQTSALQIIPTSATVTIAGSQTFSATGGSGNYTYSVSSGAGTINPTTGQYAAPGWAGTNQVSVRDSNGAIATASINVMTGGGGASVTISPATVTIAQGANTTFTATGGSGHYTYYIYYGSGSINATSGVYTAPTFAGVNYILVQDTLGLTSMATVTVSAATTGTNPFIDRLKTGGTVSVILNQNNGTLISGTTYYVKYASGSFTTSGYNSSGHFTTATYSAPSYIDNNQMNLWGACVIVATNGMLTGCQYHSYVGTAY